jgi:hypothetical protein
MNVFAAAETKRDYLDPFVSKLFRVVPYRLAVGHRRLALGISLLSAHKLVNGSLCTPN